MHLIEAFLAHWRSIPRTGRMPRLDDYLERPNPATQPWTVILDIEPSAYPTRLFGTGLVDLIGTDLTGTDHLRLFPQSERADSLRRHRETVTRPCGMYSGAESQTQKGLVVEMAGLALPLIRDGGYSIVRIIRVVQNMGYGDRVAKVTGVKPGSRWLDLGYGVPGET